MSDKELLFSFDQCDIFYNVGLKAVESQWKGPAADGEALYRILDALVDGLKLKSSNVIIADARQMQVINNEDQQWITDNWYPRALAAGFRYEALVVSKYTFNAVTVRRIVRNYDEQKLKTAYFNSVPAAYDWVKNGFPE